MTKLLYLSSSTLISDSANSVHVVRMCDCFFDHGVDVTLLAYQGRGEINDIYKYYGVRNQFTIERTAITYNSLAKVLLKLKQALPFVKVGPVPSLLHAKSHIAPLVKHNKPDVVLSRNLEWLWAGIDGPVPFIFEAHGLMSSFLQKYMFKKVTARPGFVGLVVISEALKRLYLQDFPDLSPDQILVLHDGADVPAELKDLPERSRPIVGYVGHLYKGRGGENMIEMARQLPQADFHFVGGRAEDIDRLKSLNPPANVTFFGHLPPSVLPEYFQRFDIVVAPYQAKVAISGGKGDTSSFMSPLKIFEYMAWQKAIVCSDIPVLREVLRHEENALLCQADDIDQWVHAIRELIGDDDKRKSLAYQARRDIEAHYTWSARSHNILNFIVK